MIDTLKNILAEAVARLHHQMTTYLPPLLAAATLVLGAFISAVLARWVIHRIFKGLAVDRFLRESGIAYLLAPSGNLHCTRIVATTVYWCILLSGFLLGLNVFGTDLSTRIVQGILFLLPELFVAGLIVVSGTWLGHYLGRSVLVWAVNENFPSPTRLAAIVRTLVTFAAVVIAADQLRFARSVFLAAFIIIVGGAVLATSLAIGFGRRELLRFFDHGREHEGSHERSLWTHL